MAILISGQNDDFHTFMTVQYILWQKDDVQISKLLYKVYNIEHISWWILGFSFLTMIMALSLSLYNIIGLIY